MFALLTALMLLAQGNPAPAIYSCAQALSVDGKLFAYAFTDGTVQIATLPEGKAMVVAEGFSRDIGRLTFSLDGSELATLAPDGLVRIIASKGGKLLAEWKGAPAVWGCEGNWLSSRTVSFVDGGTKLLVGGDSPDVDLIRRSDGEPLKRIRLDGGRLRAVALSADGEHFALGSEEGRCAVYSAKSGELEFGPIKVTGWVNALALDSRGGRLVIGSKDDAARLYAIAPGATPVLLSHADPKRTGELEIGYVAFSPDGKQVLSTSLPEHDMRVWAADTGAPQWSTTKGFGDWDLPVTARFVALPEPAVITCWGFMFAAKDGSSLPGIEYELHGGYHQLAGPYAWENTERGIELRDLRSRTRVCTLPPR